MDAREAPRRGLGDGTAQGALVLVRQLLWQQALDELLGGLLQDAGRLARGVLDDDTSGRVLARARDLGEAQRGRVGPAGVAVVGGEVGRAVGNERVELDTRGQASGEGRVAPALAGDPARVGMSPGPRADAGGERGEVEGVVEPQLLERPAAPEQVQVRVDEARRHEAAAQLDDVGALARERTDLTAAPDLEHGRATDRDGLGERLAGLPRPHPPAHEDAVGAARVDGRHLLRPERGRHGQERERDEGSRPASSVAKPESRHGAGTSVSTWTAGPGRNGVGSPFTQASWPSA